MTISEILRATVEKAIKDGRETRYSIAKNAGIDFTGFNRWLDDSRDIRASTIDKLGEYLGAELTIPPPAKKTAKK